MLVTVLIELCSDLAETHIVWVECPRTATLNSLSHVRRLAVGVG
jgi:hypothetical protein